MKKSHTLKQVPLKFGLVIFLLLLLILFFARLVIKNTVSVIIWRLVVLHTLIVVPGLCILLYVISSYRKQIFHLFVFAQQLQSLQDGQEPATTPYECILRTLIQYQNDLQRDIAGELSFRHLELDAWQHQINPHFLYNTLETIRSQAIEDHSLQSAEMIELLGRILRYSLSRNSNICTVDQELACLNDYIKIQQYRFFNRFDLIISIDENDFTLHRYPLPKLTLQPVVENAIYHGIDPKNSAGIIKVDFMRTDARIVITISDNGIGIAPERLKELNHMLSSFMYNQKLKSIKTQSFGLALQNINARIKLLYGYEYGITVLSVLNGGTQVIISLPVEVKK